MISKGKPLPVITTDQEAEDFIDTVDLSLYDLSGGRSIKFEFDDKAAQLNMRMPARLLDAIKTKAKGQKMPYTRYIRMLIERDIEAR